MDALRFIANQEGSALLSVLVAVVLMSVLVAAALASYLLQYRLIRRDVHRLQAQYRAEAGVHLTLDALSSGSIRVVTDTLLTLPDESTCQVTIEPFGGYVLVRVVAEAGNSRYTARVLAGDRPPDAFDHALLLWDTDSDLSLAGRAMIRGDVVIGEKGVDSLGLIFGVPFTGSLNGRVFLQPDLHAPYFDSSLFEEVWSPPTEIISADTLAYTARTAARHLPSRNPVLRINGDARFTSSDSALFREPLTVVTQGDLELDGHLDLQPTTRLIAGRQLRIRGDVTGQMVLGTAFDSLVISARVQVAGQFFSRTHIRLSEEAHLRYPSLLYLTGEALDRGGRIEMTDRAVVDGSVVHAPVDLPPALPRGRVLIDTLAQVRGAVYNALETEIHGRLRGSLLTYRLYFRETRTGTHYVNWLRDATLDRRHRPSPFHLPIGFRRERKLDVIRWDGFADFLPLP